MPISITSIHDISIIVTFSPSKIPHKIAKIGIIYVTEAANIAVVYLIRILKRTTAITELKKDSKTIKPRFSND